MSIKVAVVGLGRVGAGFLEEVLKHGGKGIEVRCVAELEETPGLAMARAAGIEVLTLDAIVALPEPVDIIFDLSGSDTVRRLLRDLMTITAERHTVVVPEVVTQMIWSLMTDRPMPDVHAHKGY